MTDIAIFSVESLADGPAGHEIFRRLLIACLSAIGGNTQEADAAFGYAGMPSEWRGAIWSAILEIENLERRGIGKRDHAHTLLEACYSNLQAFRVGLEWQIIVEATTVRTLRGLKKELIDEIVSAYQEDVDQENARRFRITLRTGKGPKRNLKFENVATILFESYACYLRNIYLLDANAEITLGDTTVMRVK